MKKFTKVCLIIVAIFMILGLAACITGAVMGAGTQNIKELWNSGDLELWGWNVGESGIGWIKKDSSWKDAKSSTDTFTAQDVKKLDIDLKYGTLTIEKSNTDEIKVEVKKNNGDFETTLENGTLKLKDNRKNGVSSKGYDISLKLPKGIELEQIKIENNAGTLESSDIALNTKKMDVKVDAGETLFENISTKDFRLEVGAGNADIDKLDAENIDIDCGVGNIDLVLLGKEDDYNYKVDCGLGNIDVNNQSYTSLGKSNEIRNGALKDISLKCGVGNITVDTE